MKPDDSMIPIGGRFLPNVSAPSLLERHKNETDSKAAARLMAYIRRKKGDSIRQIARQLGRGYSTIRDWLIRAMQLGIQGRYDIKRPGTRMWPDAGNLKQVCADLIAGPRSCGFESEVWTAPLLAVHIKKKYKVDYAVSSIYKTLHMPGLFMQKAPPPKTPQISLRIRERGVQKKARWHVRHHSKRGHTIMTGDEASFILGWNVKNSWYPVGRPGLCAVQPVKGEVLFDRGPVGKRT